MAVFKCKMCGGNLIPNPDGKTAVCDSCDSISDLPSDHDERLVNMHNRANDLRMNSEFDRAISVYEKVIAEDSGDAEAYWGLLLCKYGIEYVKDPATGRYVPTCHRAKYGSILNDPDFQEVIRRAEPGAKSRYEAQAREINTIMQEILSIAAKQEKYDVFISYKEQDNGERTLDSFRARSLYEKLTAKGIRTFYAPESLPLGKNYEPIIFSALHTSRVMVLMGSKPEYFTAPWVKNEWARYLELINNGEEKTLIPAYWDLLPDMDLPRELSSLQAVNMGTPVGELQLIEYVQKLVNAKNGKTTQPAAAAAAVSAGSVMQQEARSLLKRADIFLDNGQLSDAATYYNRVLDKDPENAQAYWGQLLCKLKCRTADEMIRKGQQISGEIAYKNAIRFASPDLKKAYQAVNTAIEEWIQSVCHMLDQALSHRMTQGKFLERAGEIEESLKKRAREVQELGQTMRQRLETMNQQMQKVTAQSQNLRGQVNNLQNQYAQSVNSFNQQKEIPVAFNMLGTLQQQRKALDDALNAYLNYCQNSQDASTLRAIFSQCRSVQGEMDQMIQFYEQQDRKLTELAQQVVNLKKQCANLKNEVQKGQYSGAWSFIGHEVHNPVSVPVK